tara:strand:- start:1015 stop:1380 length:366 start_codon:yes stop_codon:yes gene_type:complete
MNRIFSKSIHHDFNISAKGIQGYYTLQDICFSLYAPKYFIKATFERGLIHNFKQFVKNSSIFVTESFYEGDRLSSIESYYYITVHTTAEHCSVFELHQIRKDMYEYIKTFKPSHKELMPGI